MTLVTLDAAHIYARLVADGLPSLTDVLYTNNAIIAGSYTLPPISSPKNHPPYDHESGPTRTERTRDDLMDIDIWIPHTPQRAQHSQALLMYILKTGCTFKKQTHSPTPHSAMDIHPLELTRNKIPDAYKRVKEMIEKMYVVHTPKGRPIQIIIMSKKGGSTFTHVIAHFDLNLTRQFFTGKILYASPEAANDTKQGHLTLNSASKVIQQQSFPEWCRTLSRIYKYTRRGYSPTQILLTQLWTYVGKSLTYDRGIGWVPASPWSYTHVPKMYQREIMPMLNIEPYIAEWNTLVEHFQTWDYTLPCIVLSVQTNTCMLTDLRIGLASNTFVPFTGPLMARVDTIQVKNWDTLTPTEHGTMNIIGKISSNINDGETVFYTGGRVVSVSHIFPAIQMESRPYQGTPVPTKCMDMLMVEECDIEEYLKEDQDNHVFHVMLANGVLAAYGVSRDYLRNAQTFVPCAGAHRAIPATIPINESAVTAIHLGYITYNIPSTQIQYILSGRHTQCPFLLVQSTISWKRSKLHGRTDESNWEGGSANLCGSNTNRTIWFLEYFNCTVQHS